MHNEFLEKQINYIFVPPPLLLCKGVGKQIPDKMGFFLGKAAWTTMDCFQRIKEI
jgi:hypothetical protein